MTDTLNVKARLADSLAQSLAAQAETEGRRVLVVGKGACCTDLFDRIVLTEQVVRRSRTRRYIQYANGGMIVFCPATPDAARGMSCDTLCILAPISEAARASVEPTLSGVASPSTVVSYAYLGEGA
ncbi:hypothetical protein JZX82_gp81 [Gordonia phage William]|uniref:Uncharacterized protein n=1 Tax=Gordonia phage William TaxID=2571253 RepID=A0A4Y6EEP5_9CAUD|nr:hypothetical protein JZX82_gp81 [Gordonia phage William]QDF17176.1 hypothetical protein SEA_WILLIAM_81 [Gordonia phage William]